jgi:hypothetical protein
MKRSPSLGPTIQSRPDFRPAYDGRWIIKRGLRKNSFRHLQIYWCKDCGGYFVSLVGLKGVKYPPRVIARALCPVQLRIPTCTEPRNGSSRVKSNSQASSSRATSTASDLSTRTVRKTTTA